MSISLNDHENRIRALENNKEPSGKVYFHMDSLYSGGSVSFGSGFRGSFLKSSNPYKIIFVKYTIYDRNAFPSGSRTVCSTIIWPHNLLEHIMFGGVSFEIQDGESSFEIRTIGDYQQYYSLYVYGLRLTV